MALNMASEAVGGGSIPPGTTWGVMGALTLVGV